MERSPWWTLARVVAIATAIALSAKILRLEQRHGYGLALAYAQIGGLALLLWRPRAWSGLIALALTIAATVVRRDPLMTVVWLMWCATLVGLASLTLLGRSATLPDARVRR